MIKKISIFKKAHFFSLLLLLSIFLSGIFVFNFSPQALADGLGGQAGMTEVKGVFGPAAGEDIRITIVRIIKRLLGFLGIIFLVLVLVAGFNYMTSLGNEEKAKTALKQISYAVIGAIIIFTSWSITTFVFNELIKRSTTTIEGSWPN